MVSIWLAKHPQVVWNIRALRSLTGLKFRGATHSDLTEDEEAQVRSLAAGVAGLSGASEMIATLAVGAHEKAKAGEYRDQPLYTRPLGPGNLEAVANPVTAGRPLS